MDLSKLSTKDLEYLKAGQITKVSTAGLEELAKQQGSTGVLQPSVVAPVPYSPTAERVRAAAGGVTFSLADELEAAVRSGAVSGEEYRRIRDQLRAQQGQYALDRPVESTVSEVTGALAMPAALAVKPVTRGAGILGDIALGTGTGALYGVGQAQEAANIPEEAIKNALLGGGISGALSGVGRLAAPNIRPEAAALREKGIPLTPGSAFGGAYQQVEQAAESLPIAGRIVSGARERQFEKFNTAAYNKVLSNIDPALKVPSDLTGRAAYNYVEQNIRNQYETVLPKIAITYRPKVEKSFDAVVNRYSGTKLPPELSKDFKTYVDSIKADFSANQVLNGRRAQAVKEDIARMANAYSTAQGKDRLLADAYRDLENVYMTTMKNQNPAFAKELSKADSAYKDFVRVQTAMAKTRGEEGIFTPAQLEASVRQADRSARKGAFARGSAPMQDLSGTATSVLGTKVPDSGTAARGMTGALFTGGAAYIDPLAGGLTALMTAPYYRLGEKALFSPRNPTFSEAVQRARTATPYAMPGLLDYIQQD